MQQGERLARFDSQLRFLLRLEAVQWLDGTLPAPQVALVDGEEATLKRIRRMGASIALGAANPAYETRIFATDRVRVQGKLVGLIRRY